MRTRPARRGVALILALIMLGISGAVMTVTLALLRTDAARLADEVSQLQLRQLLLAGQDVAAADLASAGKIMDRSLPLPPEFSDDAVKIHSLAAEGDTLRVLIEAQAGSRRAAQTVTYQGHDRQWKLIDAAME